MLGKGPTRLKNRRREMKVKEKILAIFPWRGKKSQQRESERASERARESSPREERTRGKKERGKKDRVKPQGPKLTQYFIHRASPE